MRDELADYILTIVPTFRRKLFKHHPRECEKLTRQQVHLLIRVHHHPDKPMSFYGESMAISKPNMSKLINGMIEDGYLTRTRDLEDRRVVTIGITEEGEKLLNEISGKMVSEIKESLKALDDKDVTRLMESFETINEILGKLENKEEV